MTCRSLLWIGFVVALAACVDRPDPVDPVNSVIGDESWTAEAPPADDQVRIATHLRYVADKLDAEAPGDLAPGVAAERHRLLETLREYAARGSFPHLDEPRDHRVPRFIDSRGRLCAVGFLIASTAGLAVARDLGERFEYALIADIDDPRLDAWAATHGFSRRELAMIQPSYGFEERCNAWGNRVDGGGGANCPETELQHSRMLYSIGIGGGITRADGRDLSYFLWALDLRFALTSWLAIGVADLGLRAGPEASGGNHVAFAATPLLELSHWSGIGYAHRGNVVHLDLGLTTEHVFGGRPNPNPYAVEAAVGYRIFASDVAEPDIIAGVTVALKDGFVVDDRVSAGSVMPFIRFSFGWRP